MDLTREALVIFEHLSSIHRTKVYPAEKTINAFKVEIYKLRQHHAKKEKSPMDDLLNNPIIGKISLLDLSCSLLILFAAYLVRISVLRFVAKKMRAFAKRNRYPHYTQYTDALEKPLGIFILALGALFALDYLQLDPKTDAFIGQVFGGFSSLVATWTVVRFFEALTRDIDRRLQANDNALHSFIPFLRRVGQIIIWIVGTLTIVDNLGYQVSSILATLGLGGAALAFASKDTVANFFGSLCLVLDRPFKVGDWIQVGTKVDGNVEAIGLRSTRVRTFPKTLLSIPNNVLANETIINWSEMPKRRVKQTVGVTYSTPTQTVNQIVEDIRQLLREDEGVNQDFILVNFTDFGESSLEILVYYFTTTIAWLEHMDIRQRVNLKIMKAIEARGSSIAFPSRTLYMADRQQQFPNLGPDSQPQ